MVRRTVKIAILSCQFTSTVSSLPMLWRTHVVARCPGGPIWSLGPDFAPKIMNISFSHCRAELRSRYHWPAGALFGLQSRLCIHASMHPCIHASMHPCIHASMHPCIHAHNGVCIVICIQRPGLLYVMGGGWEMCISIVIVTATAAPD